MMLIDLCNNVLIWCARCCVGASEAAQNGIYKESSQRCPKRVYFSIPYLRVSSASAGGCLQVLCSPVMNPHGVAKQ